MRQTQPFDPIQPGEIDNFMFDLTKRVGGSYIVDTKWVCRLAPYSGGSDPDPQSRIINTTYSNTGVQYRAEDGSLQLKSGFFAIAQVGPMPPSANGGTYILGHHTFLADDRQIEDWATVQCQLPG